MSDEKGREAQERAQGGGDKTDMDMATREPGGGETITLSLSVSHILHNKKKLYTRAHTRVRTGTIMRTRYMACRHTALQTHIRTMHTRTRQHVCANTQRRVQGRTKSLHASADASLSPSCFILRLASSCLRGERIQSRISRFVPLLPCATNPFTLLPFFHCASVFLPLSISQSG